MAGVRKAEHVCLQVGNVEEATKFYEDVFGLAVIAREDDRVYFGCGFDENYDLAIAKGEPGIEHFAVRVNEAEQLDMYEERLAQKEISTRRTGGDEPGQEHGLRFRLPSDIAMELVTVHDKSYKHYYEMAVPGRGGLAPLDLDHYNFHSPDVERDAKFLRDILNFKVSAVIGNWDEGAFLRRGDLHHDVAIFKHGGPDEHASHHHTGFTVSSVDHMVQIIDRIVMHGLSLDLGIGRHFGGDNIFAYFKAPDDQALLKKSVFRLKSPARTLLLGAEPTFLTKPDDHRIELVTQMTELDDNTPVVKVDNVSRAVSAWDEDLELPDSWLRCSGLVR